MAFVYPEDYAYVDHIADHGRTAVVRALNPLGVEVALKLQDNVGNVPRRFEREIKAMLAAAGPSTMPVLDYDGTYGWYAMPLAAKTLADEVVPVETAQVAQAILRAIADSLRPLHEKGQVHRDLKPENILFLPLEDTGSWVVADFGIVRNIPGQTTAPLTVQGQLTGTWAWAAPEQYVDAHLATPATDVHSAGTLMGWLLTGNLPTPGIRYASVGTLSSTIMRATEHNQGRRFQTMDELLEHFSNHMLPSKAKLSALFEEGSYGEIHAYFLDRPDQLAPLANRMIGLDSNQVRSWIDVDLFGMVDTVEQVCSSLGEYFNDLGRDNVDRFLVWLLSVCEVMKNADQLGELAEVLSAQISTTEQLDQWTPRSAALDWIDRQPATIESLARSVIDQTDTWDFLAIEARSRWPSRRRTTLLQDLADT